MFVNDVIGDGEDRWRTGGYTVSWMRGTRWNDLPATMGEVLELRARAEVIAPANLTRPPAGDRRYAGVLALGVHSHFDHHGWDTRLGADLVLIGPQTGLASFQKLIHRLADMPSPRVASNQIGNRLRPTLSAETGRDLSFGAVTLRPFVEAQAGVETFVRTGADLTIGHIADGALMLRETVTGQRYRAISGTGAPGLTFVMGGDIARVFDSALLPEDGAAVAGKTRSRLRAGLHWQGEQSEVFYGVTMLGKEFDQQPDPQVTGALSLRFRF